jgi:hypothetical protein
VAPSAAARRPEDRRIVDLDDVEQAAHLVDDRLLVSVAERTD